ncbi:MAG: hypothetical protein M1522_08795 [Actinobacteria bacterium]|jgi:hypothetical protein|nr:hypothetical protein [Actinomycetota bacterium]
MLKVRGAPFTTFHSQVLYPWQCQRGLPPVGPVIGVDDLAGGTKFHYDPWELYRRGLLTGANMLVLGQIGKGKSAFIKTYVGRLVLTNDIRPFVVDPKREYGPFGELYGIPTLRLAPGGKGGRLNPLDAGPFGQEDGDSRVRQIELINALAASGLERELTAGERAALGVIVEHVVMTARAQGKVPTLPDVADALFSPPVDAARTLHTQSDQLRDEVRQPALAIQRLLRGDFAGMLDGPTSIPANWAERGLIVDLSAVYQSDALAPVMLCAATWLRQAASEQPRPTLIVLDEAWAVLRLKSVTRWIQATAKLSRSFGVSLVLVVHRISDLESQGDAGSEAVRQAYGFLSDTETRVLYAQPDSEADTIQRVLGLTDTEVETVLRLPPHKALWKVGAHAALVRHVLSPLEHQMVNTDQAMAKR